MIEPCPGTDKDDSINVPGTVFKGMTYQGLVNIYICPLVNKPIDAP